MSKSTTHRQAHGRLAVCHQRAHISAVLDALPNVGTLTQLLSDLARITVQMRPFVAIYGCRPLHVRSFSKLFSWTSLICCRCCLSSFLNMSVPSLSLLTARHRCSCAADDAAPRESKHFQARSHVNSVPLSGRRRCPTVVFAHRL